MPNREYTPTTLQELGRLREAVHEVGVALQPVALANHRRTTRKIRALATVMATLVLTVAVLLFVTVQNHRALTDANKTIADAKSCLDPAGECYRDVDRAVNANIDRALHQLECDLRYYCREGFVPQTPPPPGYAP